MQHHVLLNDLTFKQSTRIMAATWKHSSIDLFDKRVAYWKPDN